MIIALTLKDGRARVAPFSFLGPKHFDIYRRICESAGATFDRETKANIAMLDRVPVLMDALRKDGFEPRVHPLLQAAMGQRAEQVRAESAAAGQRIGNLAAALAKHGLSPFPYQVNGIHWLAPRLSGLLCDEPGLGKTMQGLGAAPENAPIIVIAPAVAKGVWLRETLRWRPDLQPMVLSGRGSFRVPVAGEMVILNPDILPELESVDDDGTLVKLQPFKDLTANTTLIVDECHAFKSSKTKRTEKLRKLIKAAFKSGGRAWGLTGTPLMNKPEELASLLTTFGLFNECFGGWSRYLRVMNASKAQWGGYNWGDPRPEAIEGIKRVMLRRLRAEVLPQLPGKLYEYVDVDPDAATGKALDAARALLDSLGVSLDGAISQGKSLGGSFEEISKLRKVLATAKVPALLERIEVHEENQEPLLVFSAHRAPILALQGRPGWAVITGDTPAADRTRIEEAFQRGILKGVAGTIDSMGVAITLTRSHRAIFVDLEWTPAANQQAEDRICRIGQTKGVIIEILRFPGTLDEDVIELLRAKQRIIDSTVNAAAVKGGAQQGELL